MSPEEELVEQFRHELPLRVGDELKALLSSFSGKDDAFYVLLVNENTLATDQAMSQFQSNPIVNRPSSEIPRLKTFVHLSCPLTRSRISSFSFSLVVARWNTTVDLLNALANAAQHWDYQVYCDSSIPSDNSSMTRRVDLVALHSDSFFFMSLLDYFSMISLSLSLSSSSVCVLSELEINNKKYFSVDLHILDRKDERPSRCSW